MHVYVYVVVYVYVYLRVYMFVSGWGLKVSDPAFVLHKIRALTSACYFTSANLRGTLFQPCLLAVYVHMYFHGV